MWVCTYVENGGRISYLSKENKLHVKYPYCDPNSCSVNFE